MVRINTSSYVTKQFELPRKIHESTVSANLSPKQYILGNIQILISISSHASELYACKTLVECPQNYLSDFPVSQ